MNHIYLLLTIGLISQGCASGTPQGSSGSSAGSPAPQTPTPALNANCPVTPLPNPVFIIPCRETVNGMPDVLVKNLNNINKIADILDVDADLLVTLAIKDRDDRFKSKAA